MRSIPWAMTWELLARGRWMLPASVLAAYALPIALLAALRRDGALDPHDRSIMIMHLVLMQIGAFVVGAALFGVHGSTRRLYVYPLPTSTLVAWRLIPAMVFMFVQSVAGTLLLNLLFEVDWPLWGPAMFLAVALAAIYAAVWLAEKSGWVILTLTVVSSLLGLWNKSRYGATFSEPQHMWREVTPGEVAALLAVALLSYAVGVFAVGRNRRGQSLPELGLVAWLLRTFDRPATGESAFRTAERAQFWYEWVRKGWAMPAATALAIFVCVSCWAIWNRDGRTLLEGFIAGGGLLSVLAMICGLVLGNTGSNDANFQIGSFLATRPVTSTSLAHTLLKMAALSVLLMWLVWAAAGLTTWSIMWAVEGVPSVALPKALGWWYFPVTLLGAWVVVGLGILIGLVGRIELSVKLLLAAIVAFIAAELTAKYTMSPAMRLQLWHGLIAASGVLLVLCTACASLAAWRRGFIASPLFYFVIGAWGIMAGLLVADYELVARAPAQAYLFFAGAAALVVAPLGAAPLALAWNRVR